MKIAHVLPVQTNEKRIQEIRKTLLKNLHKSTELDIVTYNKGPSDLEHYFDDHKAISLMIEDNVRLNSYDAISIACFYDPGIRELRELLSIPVIGISEASLALAQIYGYQHGIIVSRSKNIPKMNDNMKLYGIEDKVCCWQSLNLTVQELHKRSGKELLQLSSLLIQDAITNHNAEVIILGCGALSGLENKLQSRFNIPVINPIVAGAKMAETLAELKLTANLTTSKINDYGFKNE